jgi:hypothetical protein
MDPATPATNTHRWQPGQSGNPAGRPKRGESLAEIVRRSVDPHELVDTLLSIARSVGAKSSDRIAAVGLIMDRGWGKPLAQVEVTARQELVEPELASRLDDLSPEQLEALFALGIVPSPAGQLLMIPSEDGEAREAVPAASVIDVPSTEQAPDPVP